MSSPFYTLDSEFLAAFRVALSPERLETYLRHTNGDQVLALRLYTWNTAVSAAFYGPLQALEVSLRNALHEQLYAAYGERWYENPAAGLAGNTLRKVEEAKRKLERSRYTLEPSRLITELSFGFWVGLLGHGGQRNDQNQGKASYEMTLWRPALHRAFPNVRISRKAAHRPLDYLRMVRNRIAHHEPIFSRYLEKDYASILQVTEWISFQAADWIRGHSRVAGLLKLDWRTNDLQF